MVMSIERVAPASKAVILLLSSSVFFAALSAGLHSHLDKISHVFLTGSMILGFFALLKIINSVVSKFFIARPVHWIHAMIFEILALLAITVLRLLRLSSPKKIRPNITQERGSAKPILLVHGYCHDSSAWAYIQGQLARETFSPIYTIDLGYPFHSMHEYAKRVTERAEQIKKETGQTDLILIGHSMGGLISSIVAMKEAQSISSVFTIASPMSGTHMAKIGVGPNAREMQPRSPLISDLNKQLGAETNIRFYHIGTKTDQIVIPGSSALRGHHPQREFLFEDMGHASLLFSPRVVGLLVHWLRDL
jgi:pimeloyl-ACP methyl ester carboxylesterase